MSPMTLENLDFIKKHIEEVSEMLVFRDVLHGTKDKKLIVTTSSPLGFTDTVEILKKLIHSGLILIPNFEVEKNELEKDEHGNVARIFTVKPSNHSLERYSEMLKKIPVSVNQMLLSKQADEVLNLLTDKAKKLGKNDIAVSFRDISSKDWELVNLNLALLYLEDKKQITIKSVELDFYRKNPQTRRVDFLVFSVFVKRTINHSSKVEISELGDFDLTDEIFIKKSGAIWKNGEHAPIGKVGPAGYYLISRIQKGRKLNKKDCQTIKFKWSTMGQKKCHINRFCEKEIISLNQKTGDYYLT